MNLNDVVRKEFLVSSYESTLKLQITKFRKAGDELAVPKILDSMVLMNRALSSVFSLQAGSHSNVTGHSFCSCMRLLMPSRTIHLGLSSDVDCDWKGVPQTLGRACSM
ncbi:MAG TPA: hypothetical protein PKM72_04385 [Nitrospirales bacterium]|nr:hypothetical protein [Nitrospirales bacterium]